MNTQAITNTKSGGTNHGVGTRADPGHGQDREDEVNAAQHQPASSTLPPLTKNDDAGCSQELIGFARDKYSRALAVKFFASKSSSLGQSITREYEWLSSFYRSDPRWKIMNYFDEVAVEGRAPRSRGSAFLPAATLFRKKTNVFTVWRPTSREAIRNMMLGEATGKGMDVKGKSARSGNISSFVPFIQICEDAHKEQVQVAHLKDGGMVRVYFSTDTQREAAREILLDAKREMLLGAAEAANVLKKFNSGIFVTEADQELALQCSANKEGNLRLEMVNRLAPKFYGVDVSERLFWDAFVMKQDCSRPEGTEWFINRGSSVHLMNANLNSMRESTRVVVYQKNVKNVNPMEPRTLLIAYEENGTVKPVVSDFDLFLLGSRGLDYKCQISKEHTELMQWLIRNIGHLLHDQKLLNKRANWSECWQDVIRRSALLDGYYPETPQYGHNDPVSDNIIQHAAYHLRETGCVRHGPECFNLHFPGDIDDEFLVICNILHNNIPWRYMNVPQLQDLLMEMIDDGFCFPLNPKWVLCDGWKKVYDKLMASECANVQDSLNCWFPPNTGIREEIERIAQQYPDGLDEIAETVFDASSINSGVKETGRQERRETMSKSQVDKALLRKIQSEFCDEEEEEKLPGSQKGIGKLNSAIGGFSFTDMSKRSAMKSWRRKQWLSSFCRSDPRRQILDCFNKLAEELKMPEAPEKASIFTIWRGSSIQHRDGIQKMMLGEAIGKNLDIKGITAKRGALKSFVPFLEIHEDKHKEMSWSSLNDGQFFRVFYPTKDCRLEAFKHLLVTKEHMLYELRVLKDNHFNPSEHAVVMGDRVSSTLKPEVRLVNDYAPNVYGLEIEEKLFWESYVMQQDCYRLEGSEWDTGKKPLMNSMQLNISTLQRKTSALMAVPTLYQTNSSNAMEPRSLVMGYEEGETVKPVVSDLDCFLWGTQNVSYKDKASKNQCDWMRWLVDNVEGILEKWSTGQTPDWIEAWLGIIENLDDSMRKKLWIPKYGFGDPQSYRIFKGAVEGLQGTGCVRHGAECYNFIFPQTIDESFLVISDSLPGKVPWKYVGVSELQDFLCEQIKEGYTFPINPKWVLYDPGWKRVYDELLASDNQTTQDSLNCWFPPETGMREAIARIWNTYSSSILAQKSKIKERTWIDCVESGSSIPTFKVEVDE